VWFGGRHADDPRTDVPAIDDVPHTDDVPSDHVNDRAHSDRRAADGRVRRGGSR